MKKTFTSLMLALLCTIAANAQRFTTVPESGTSVTMLTDIHITFNNATTVTVDLVKMVGGAKAYAVDGENKTWVSDIICAPAAGNSLIMTFMTSVSDAGNYLVEIPDSLFTVDGVAMRAFTLEYIIAGIPTSTATIKAEMQNNAPDTILLTFDPCEQLTLHQPQEGEEIEAPFLIYNNGINSTRTPYAITITGTNTATLGINKKLPEGLYTLHIPKGNFLIDGKVNRKVLFDFTYTKINPAEEYTVTPTDSSTLDELVEINITWEKATTVEVSPTLMQGGIKVYTLDGENKTLKTDIFCGPAFGNKVTLSLTTSTNDAGNYLVEIPDNMFTVDGTVVAPFNLHYTIAGIPVSSATIKAEMKDQSPRTILLTFEPCEKLKLYEPQEGEEIEAPFIVLNNGINSTRTPYTITITGTNTATLSTDKELPQGLYTLHIPKGNFLIDGKLNTLTLFDFEQSNIDGIMTDNTPINVYNLQGVQVVTNGTADDIKHLDRGIYIINGKKQVVQGDK